MFQATSLGEAYWPSSRLKPLAATWRIDRSPPAPIQICGWGCCAVGGSTTMASNCQYLPRCENGSSVVHALRMTSRHSSNRASASFGRYAESGELIVAIALADPEIETAAG